VVLNVRSGVYQEQVDLLPVAGSSTTNTITIQPETGSATDVRLEFPTSNTGSNFVMRLNGIDFLRLRRLTLASSGLDASYRSVMAMRGCVENLLLQENVLSGYAVNSGSLSYALVVADDAMTTNLQVTGNTFGTGDMLSISIVPATHCLPGRGSGGNIVNNPTGYSGFSLTYHAAPQLDSNTISCTSYGLDINNCPDTLRVRKNKIALTGSYYGIQLQSCSSNQFYPGLVANNFVTAATAPGYGIYLTSSSYQNVIHNSVAIPGSSTSGYAFYVTGDQRSTL